jgi:hypothetical protein
MSDLRRLQTPQEPKALIIVAYVIKTPVLG